MVLLNTWRLEGRRLVSLLARGEQTLAFTPTTLERTHFELLERLKADTAANEGKKSSPFWKVAGAIATVVDFVPSVGDRVTAKLDNEPVGGAEGSTARTIGRQVDAVPMGDQHYLAVTDRRFLVLHGKTGGRDPLTPVAEVDRSAVRTAEVRKNLLAGSIGRLRVTFADDSWLEFADAINMGRQRATEVRDALVDGRRSVEGEPGPPPQP